MAYSKSLTGRIRQVFARRCVITEKKMFGGVASCFTATCASAFLRPRSS